MRVVGRSEAPTGPVVFSILTESSVTLSWQDVQDDGGSNITSYKVERREVCKRAWITVDNNVTGNSCDVTGN